ncbi:RadC family protein [Variovorax sp. OV329]|uniref:JAB domain-containing protein n=1 Tax=Variovorax sp. OV329 TaxID=1882825 RepID=UPI0008E81F4A|nr:JAB domain-containing protein [Variovorax sp. OV329]SFM91885.1 DNA repair protein radc [Variovorax sp. OV329]
MNNYTPTEQRVVDQLRLFLGKDAPAGRESAHPAYRLLAAGLALAQEVLIEPVRSKPIFDSPQAVEDYLTLHFAGQGHESFVVLYFDAQLCLIAVQELIRGTITQTSVYPREVLREALRHGAAGILCSHCHPSQSCEPSRADELLASALQDALKCIDVRVIDHIVVAGPRTRAFAKSGLL